MRPQPNPRPIPTFERPLSVLLDQTSAKLGAKAEQQMESDTTVRTAGVLTHLKAQNASE